MHEQRSLGDRAHKLICLHACECSFNGLPVLLLLHTKALQEEGWLRMQRERAKEKTTKRKRKWTEMFTLGWGLCKRHFVIASSSPPIAFCLNGSNSLSFPFHASVFSLSDFACSLSFFSSLSKCYWRRQGQEQQQQTQHLSH